MEYDYICYIEHIYNKHNMLRDMLERYNSVIIAFKSVKSSLRLAQINADTNRNNKKHYLGF